MANRSTAPEGWPALPDLREPSPPRRRRAWGKLSHEERYRRQRSDLLRAAARLASREGYAGTRVADIVSEAGLSKTTFYEHFSSKEECFLELFERTATGMLRAGVEAAEATEGRPRFERVLAVVRALVGFVEQDPRLARVLRTELGSADAPAAAPREQHLDRVIELFVTLGHRLGSELPARDLRMTARIIVQGVTDVLPELERQPETLDEQLESVARLCCRALGFDGED